jgi:hypothetical protein
MSDGKAEFNHDGFSKLIRWISAPEFRLDPRPHDFQDRRKPSIYLEEDRRSLSVSQSLPGILRRRTIN